MAAGEPLIVVSAPALPDGVDSLGLVDLSSG